MFCLLFQSYQKLTPQTIELIGPWEISMKSKIIDLQAYDNDNDNENNFIAM